MGNYKVDKVVNNMVLFKSREKEDFCNLGSIWILNAEKRKDVNDSICGRDH